MIYHIIPADEEELHDLDSLCVCGTYLESNDAVMDIGCDGDMVYVHDYFGPKPVLKEGESENFVLLQTVSE